MSPAPGWSAEPLRAHVYFGGSFDPPHLGHHEMAKILLNDVHCERLHVVPTSLNPLKKVADPLEAVLGSVERRREWMKLWHQTLSRESNGETASKLTLEWIELESATNTTPRYTIDTLKTLRERKGSAKLPWVMALGSDSIADLHRWKDACELLSSLHSVWVFCRAFETAPLSALDESLKSLCAFRILTHPIQNISSTDVRRTLRSSDAQNRKTVPVLPSILQDLGSSLF